MKLVAPNNKELMNLICYVATVYINTLDNEFRRNKC